MPLIPGITNAELDAWRDPEAEIQHTEPSDPDQHRCMYHDVPISPVDAVVITRWSMIGASCRPCAQAIHAYLHGGGLDDVNRQTIVTAAKISIGMTKALGQYDEPATITELRPRESPETDTDDPECE